MNKLEKIDNCSNREKELKNKIRKELVKLEYNLSYSGTEDLIDVIYLLYSSKKYYKFSLESEIYPIIANIHNDNIKTIKSNIINATDKMFYDCDEEILRNYIGNYEMIKPGPKKVIRAVLKKIKERE